MSFDVEKNTRSTLTLAAILTAAVLIRYVLFVGIIGSDDVSIAKYALTVLDTGFYLPDGHYAARIGLIYPQALVFYLFGVGDWQFAVLPFFSSLAGVLLAYGVAQQLGGEKVGVLAAGLLTIFPLDVCFATQLMPDLPLGTLLGVAFYMLLRAGGSASRKTAWAVGAGLVWGGAYLIKVEAFFFLFVVFTLWFVGRLSLRVLLTVGLSVAAVVAAEFFVYWLVSGDPLLRLHVATVQGGGEMVKEYSMTQLWVFPKAWFVTPYYFGLHYYLFFSSVVWVAWKRRVELWPLLVWVLIFLLWLQFGGNPFSETYRVKSHLLRYCNMINVPMAVLLAFFLREGVRNVSILAFRGAIILCLLASVLLAPFNQLNFERQIATKKLLDVVRASSLGSVFMDRTSHDLAYYYLHDMAREGRFASLQIHDFRAMRTELVDPAQNADYLLINRGFVSYGYNRYRVAKVAPEDYLEGFQQIKIINNPANPFSYLSAGYFRQLAGLLPVPFLRQKIRQTADELLEGRDAVLMVSTKIQGRIE